MIVFYALVACVAMRFIVPTTYLLIWVLDRPLADRLALPAIVLAVVVGGYDTVRRGALLRGEASRRG